MVLWGIITVHKFEDDHFMIILRVAFAIPLMQYFDYLHDGIEAIEVGCRVEVPFGRQRRIGIVVEKTTESDYPTEKLKTIYRQLDSKPLFQDKLYQLLCWSANYYQVGLGEVLFQALPIPLRQGKELLSDNDHYWQITSLGKEALDNGDLKRAKKQLQAIELFVHTEENIVGADSINQCDKVHAKFTSKELLTYDVKPNIIKALYEKGYLARIETKHQPNLWFKQSLATENNQDSWLNKYNKHQLNRQQVDALSKMSFATGFNCWLLEGVTGSGKTEVYLQMMEEVLKKGQQVLLLVPEIGLTPQLISSVERRFKLMIEVLHSRLTPRQRLQGWQRSKSGEAAVVIGTRSALFSQFNDLGLIIIDEEHDSSYKQQETGWRFHARDLAVLRAKTAQIPIILGSATPSFESLSNVANHKYQLLQLQQRAVSTTPITQQLIDLRNQPLERGISHQLLAKMQFHLKQGNQVMLFLNRRGYAPRLLCHECGWVAECEACERPFTYHQKSNILACHHCQTKKKIPYQCANCGSTHLLTTGLGTEQLEKILNEIMPEYQTVRIDRDSISRKGELENHLEEMRENRAQILIGTQIIAKGHHFPNVTLVGLINVDGALFSEDFRSEERLAQLYVQVSGRAGRGEKAGEVLLQTHFPEHPLLQTLLHQGYRAFAEEALEMRKQMGLPPYASQAVVKGRAKNAEAAQVALEKIAESLTSYCQIENISGLEILGPIATLQSKKAGYYGYQLLLQHQSRQMLQRCLSYYSQYQQQISNHSQVRISLDVDPIDFS